MVKVIAPPVQEPVSRSDFKLWMRNVPITTEQEPMVDGLLQTAREAAEKYQNTAYMEQTLQISLDKTTESAIVLPRPPFGSLVSVTCYDTGGAATDITERFVVDDVTWPAEIRMKDGEVWPSISYRNQNAILVTYKAGVSDKNAVPGKVKQAIMLHAAWAFMNPTGDATVPASFYALLGSGRVAPV